MQTLSQTDEGHPRAIESIRFALTHARLHHAYIISSPDEARAQAFATALGQSLVCATRGQEGSVDACGTCSPCRSYEQSSSANVFTLVPNDRGVIPIDAVRTLIPRLALRSTDGSLKVIRIFRADRMNPAAQNALLKTLEEPSGDTCFLLTASRPHSLLTTVRSRCQRLQLGTTDWSDAVQSLIRAEIDESLARELAPLVGTDVSRAITLQEGGAAEIIERVDSVLDHPDNRTRAIDAAKDLGSDRDRADFALAVLELRVRDALVHRAGGDELRLASKKSKALVSATRLNDLVDKLQRLRRLQNRSLNRTLALESILLNISSGA